MLLLKNAEVVLLRAGGAHHNTSCVAPIWTARSLCAYTQHGWLYCTGRIFDSIKFKSEGKSFIYIDCVHHYNDDDLKVIMLTKMTVMMMMETIMTIMPT